MQWFGPSASVDVTEHDGELLFLVKRQRRKIDILLASGAFLISITLLWSANWTWAALVGLYAISSLVSFSLPKTAQLYVDSGKLRFSESGLLEDKAGAYRWTEIERYRVPAGR